ncbi:hypothetical protein Cni_G26140 [Canna indica]|uniref:Uncharacterized protein n=1 Tax=Canna indica TaxID=4628 RepID=A0AAQ3KZ32_9LILI|nr:hypothetical protein Cni_G26140 [Canna indica]
MEAYGSSHCLDIEEQHYVDLFSTFPNLVELVLGPRAWFILPESLRFSDELRSLTKLVVHIPLHEIDTTMISWKLSPLLTYANLYRIVMLVPSSACIDIRASAITKCISNFPHIRWTWGALKG